MKLKLPKSKPFDVVGIGRNSWDRIVVVDQYPRPDTKVEVKEVHHQAGGQVATTMVAASRLGAKVRYLGKFGDDAAGRAVRGVMAKESIDLLGSRVSHQIPNQISFIVVDRTHHTRNVYGYSDPRLRPTLDDFKAEHVQSGKILFLGGRFPSDMIQFAKLAQSKGSLLVVDADKVDPSTKELLELCDVVLTPEEFPTAFTNEPVIEKALQKISELGPRFVVCTLGSEGAIGLFHKKIYRVHAPKTKIIDTTGAGDVFQGAFLVGLLEKMAPERLLKFACAAAGMKCTKIGGQAGIPTRKALNQFLHA